MDDLNKRLETASRLRDTIAADARRVEGRLEAAEANLRTVEAECRAKGIDPDTIDTVIDRLNTRYTDLVAQVEREVASANVALAPFLKE